MYKIGDKVLYPTHGAGIIDSIEENIVMGEKHRYYTVKMPVGDMKIMIPVDNAEATGLRKIISAQEAENVILYLKESVKDEAVSWNHRFRENGERIKSGDAFAVADVVKMLTKREKSKGLSTGEKKMLSDARQILVSELVLALDSDKEAVMKRVDESMEKEQNV